MVPFGGFGDRHWGMGMLISVGGQVQGQIWGMFILWGWGSFGTDIGDVNIVGSRGPGAEIGNVNILGSVWEGFGTDIGYVNIVGPGKGRGLGTDIGNINIGGG